MEREKEKEKGIRRRLRKLLRRSSFGISAYFFYVRQLTTRALAHAHARMEIMFLNEDSLFFVAFQKNVKMKLEKGGNKIREKKIDEASSIISRYSLFVVRGCEWRAHDACNAK